MLPTNYNNDICTFSKNTDKILIPTSSIKIVSRTSDALWGSSIFNFRFPLPPWLHMHKRLERPDDSYNFRLWHDDQFVTETMNGNAAI